MGKAQALDTVLDAAALLLGERVEFVLIGGGIDVDRLRARTEAERIDNVAFLPRRPPSEIGDVLASADALLVHLRRDPLFEITVPSKTQAYMVAGKPILMGVSGDATQMVEEADNGVSFTPEDPSALADAVRQVMALPPEELAAMGARGQDYYESNLSLAVGAGRLAEVLERAGRSRHPFERTEPSMSSVPEPLWLCSRSRWVSSQWRSGESSAARSSSADLAPGARANRSPC